MLVAAAGMRYVVLPSRMILPADTDTTIVYDGTVSGVNAEAAATGDLANLIMRSVPVRVERHVKVVEADKTRALVNDHSVVSFVESGKVFATTDYFYTLDRKSMHSVSNFTTHAAENSVGITIGFPIGTGTHSYTGWVQELRATAEIGYVITEDHYGLETYRFSGKATGPVTDPATLAKLPAQMPRDQLSLLAMALDVPQAMQSQLTSALSTLPETVQLTYALDQVGTFSVDPTTGIIVDMSRSNVTSVVLNQAPAVAIPISTVKIKYTRQNVVDQAALAIDGNRTVALFGTAIPAALVVLGLLSIVGSIPAIVGRRHTPADKASNSPLRVDIHA
ncbi:DUF3068 domain-containing protein [Antrihabitans sp. YC2-6]|nr:DUF3068 domain-containing protein [Antrihabitans sp. YC2-6]